jgi:hypothetical protein
MACWPILLIVAACVAADEPGLLVRLYDVGAEMHWLPELAASQLPNEVKVVSTLDLRLEKKDFGTLADNFLTEVVGRIRIEQAGGYAFRLVSDDGAKLWIDDRLVVDHDGDHGPTAKDGRIELTAGAHDLRVMHFNGSGGAQLALLWLTPAPKLDGLEPVPAEVLTHAADLSRTTAAGKKKIIPALRRGRPGDGRPLDRPHPSYMAETPEWPDNTAISGCLADGAWRTMSWPSGRAITPLVAWLPDDNGQTTYASAYVIGPQGSWDKAVLVPTDARWWSGDPNEEPFLRQVIVWSARGESKRLVQQAIPLPAGKGPDVKLQNQGCVFRFGAVGRERRASGQKTFEMLKIWPVSNGLEIEFTQPLDPRVGWDPESYYIEQWPFDLKEGGGPQRDGVVYPAKSASVSADRRKVFVELGSLKPAHVVYLRLLPPCVSENGALPWSTEAWYTLNVVPREQRGTVLPPPAPQPANFLTPGEEQAGWRLLFDGQTTKGWHGYKQDKFPAGWQVSGGCLVRVGPGGDIITDEEFGDFELSLEWRISPGGNSGIMYRVAEDHDWPWQTGPEYQLLDNTEHADGQEPKTSAASCYALYAPRRAATVPVGLFNTTRIVVRGGHVEHWLNDVKVVEYELGSPAWEQLIKDSKFGTMPDFGRQAKGKLNLQDHGDKVWYRNIKIRVGK